MYKVRGIKQLKLSGIPGPLITPALRRRICARTSITIHAARELGGPWICGKEKNVGVGEKGRGLTKDTLQPKKITDAATLRRKSAGER